MIKKRRPWENSKIIQNTFNLIKNIAFALFAIRSATANYFWVKSRITIQSTYVYGVVHMPIT